MSEPTGTVEGDREDARRERVAAVRSKALRRGARPVLDPEGIQRLTRQVQWLLIVAALFPAVVPFAPSGGQTHAWNLFWSFTRVAGILLLYSILVLRNGRYGEPAWAGFGASAVLGGCLAVGAPLLAAPMERAFPATWPLARVLAASCYAAVVAWWGHRAMPGSAQPFLLAVPIAGAIVGLACGWALHHGLGSDLASLWARTLPRLWWLPAAWMLRRQGPGPESRAGRVLADSRDLARIQPD